MTNTKRIRLTRAILLGGKHAEEGSVHELAKSLALDLIAEGSAVRLRNLWWAVAACLVIVVGAVLWLGLARGWW
jgi:hypothetical protein